MFNWISNSGNPLLGVFNHLQEITGGDLINNGYVRIFVPSVSAVSSDPKILLKRDGTTDGYWSSNSNEPNKFLMFSIKYQIKVNGIGFVTYYKDLYSEYTVSISNDLINWDFFNFSIKDHQMIYDGENIYSQISNLKPGRFIKITPLSPWQEYTTVYKNFAIYRIDFFGKLIPDIINTH